MTRKENDLRIGFHSIESIINHNPHKIKKVLLPVNRDDLRINELITSMDKNDIKYEVSNKVKQEPEAMIANDPELNFKDLKNYLNSNFVNRPLILILDDWATPGCRPLPLWCPPSPSSRQPPARGCAHPRP